MFLAIALLLAQADDFVRVDRDDRVERAHGRRSTVAIESFQFFEFAPASGTGMGTACACTNPTGAKGETLTFTRASSATCTATATGGLATTGIANGDLVTCSTNQARVEYDAAGVKGLLVEGARTNSVVRSDEMDNASWSNVASGSSITVTANAATSPFGTLTAERYQFGATTGAQYSLALQAGACPASASVASVFIKGNGTSGVTDICTAVGTTTCGVCNFVADSWTRCALTVSSFGTQINIGNAGVFTGGVSRSAADVFLSGVQCEAGTFVSSYIPTTSAAVTRATEATGWFDLGASAPAANLFSSAATVTHSWLYNVGNGLGYPGVLSASPAAANDASGKGWLMYSPGSGGTSARCWGGNDAAGVTTTGTVSTLASSQRMWCSANSALNGAYGANTMSASAAQSGTFSPARYLSIGVFAAGVGEPWWGIISKACVSPDPAACR